MRNPIYIAALLVVMGEAWLLLSLPLLLDAGAMAIFFHLFVIGYGERALRRRFGDAYAGYVRTVPRWIPTPAAPQLKPHARIRVLWGLFWAFPLPSGNSASA